MRNLHAQSDDELVEIIKDKYTTYKIMINRRKEIIVEIVDQKDDEYRFERGMTDYIEYHKLEKYDDDNDHAEAYDNKVAKKAARELDRTVYGGANVRDLDRDELQAQAETQHYPESMVSAAQSSVGTRARAPSSAAASVARPPQQSQPPHQRPNTSSMVVIDETQVGTGPGWQLLRRAKSSSNLSTTSAASGGLPVPKGSCGSSVSDFPAAASSGFTCEQLAQMEDGQGNGLASATASEAEVGWAPGPDSAGSANAAAALAAADAAQMCPKALDERSRQDATKALKAIMADFGTDDDHFDHSRQSKACDAAISRLRKHARKCSNSGDEDLRNFGQQLWDCADEIEERQSLFEDGRTKFAQVVTAKPSAARLIIMRVMSEQTICNFVSREAARLSDGALANHMTGRALILALAGQCRSEPPRPWTSFYQG